MTMQTQAAAATPLSDKCTREVLGMQQDDPAEGGITAALPLGCLNFLHPQCEDLCPQKLHCPRAEEPLCPRYNTCKPHLNTLTIARVLAAARASFVDQNRPDMYCILDVSRLPEDDPDCLLDWFGRELIRPAQMAQGGIRTVQIAIDTEVNKLFPELRN